MNTQTARNQLDSRRIWLAALVCAGIGGLVFQWWGNATRGYIHSGSLFYWWGVQWFDPAAELQHGPLVLAVSAWLFRRNLRIQKAPTSATSAKADTAPLLAMVSGLGLHLAGYAVQQPRVSIVALLIFAWGVLRLGGGRAWGRAAIFPLGFLLLAMPLSFLDTLGFNLRMLVTERAFGLAKWFGIALVRNGTQLVSADGRFHYDVAAACSGVRSLVALIALALLVGYLNFRSGWARLALALVCLPYVVLGNIVRVLFLVGVGEKTGAEAGRWMHDGSGFLVFAVVLALLVTTVALLRRGGLAKPVVEGSAESSGTAQGAAEPGSFWRMPMVVGTAAVLVAGGVLWLDARPRIAMAGVRLAEDGLAPAELPDFIGTEWAGRSAEVTAIERETLPPDTGYSRKIYTALADRKQQVFVSIVLSGRDRTSIHRPELCLVGQGWTIVGRETRTWKLAEDAVPMTLLRIEHGASDLSGAPRVVKSLLAYCFVGSERVVATHAGMQWQDVVGRMAHLRAERWAYVVVQSVVAEGEEAAAIEHMNSVIAGVWPTIRPDRATGVSKLSLPAKKD